MDDLCQIETCDRSPYSRGWCEMHYRRWLRTGDPTAWDERPTVCTVDDCDNDVDARGLCHGHYQRVLRNGDLKPEEPLTRRKQPEQCTVDDCDRPTNAKGLCRGHRAREVEYGDTFSDVPLATPDRPDSCRQESCSGLPVARGLCDTHYIQLLRGERFDGVALEGLPRGGGGLSHGYVKVVVPAPLVPTVGRRHETEHRLVMAVQLGRQLLPDETVHHTNGNRLDNRSENLELWSTMHPKGQRVEDKVTFALEILRRYLPEALVTSERDERTAG